jgi:formate hydrogenlyase subunit 6/NADH:ubiquinone oxidoreductase subunit I
MLNIILARLQQKHRTMKYPAAPAPALPDRFRGSPILDATKCPVGCHACADACPTRAIELGNQALIDLGKCLFCTDCIQTCPRQAITHSCDYRLSSRQRQDLLVTQDGSALKLASALDKKLRNLLGRSLKLRQVSAGGCNLCCCSVRCDFN